ncbi:MAG TPA: hypothetical protein VHS52_04675 [Acidimicrobiales bacterium]|jgi:hypothetical protein|nr:hypothetical protein [Acidimicrobiales bacterium]
MATSPSDGPAGQEAATAAGGTAAVITAGGVPSPEEMAAIMAALEVVLAPEAAKPAAVPAWRWSGMALWSRRPGGTPWRGLSWAPPSGTSAAR